MAEIKDPENTFIMETTKGKVVIEAFPNVAPKHVDRIRELTREGPDHQPLFTVEVRLETGEAESAKAGAKRQAEQAAAKALLARMERG